MNTEKFDAELRNAYESGFRAAYLDAEPVCPPIRYNTGDLRAMYFAGVDAGKEARQERIKGWKCLPPQEPDGKGDLT